MDYGPTGDNGTRPMVTPGIVTRVLSAIFDHEGLGSSRRHGGTRRRSQNTVTRTAWVPIEIRC